MKFYTLNEHSFYLSTILNNEQVRKAGKKENEPGSWEKRSNEEQRKEEGSKWR